MCMSPLELYRNTKENKWQVYYDSKTCDLYQRAYAPCGKCYECKQTWRRQLALKTSLELKNGRAMFINPTYNDDNLPENKGLNHKDWQDFMKRLRRALEYRGFKGKIKALVCGEYGTTGTERPHYHAIIFGISLDEFEEIFDCRSRAAGKSKRNHQLWINEKLEEIWSCGFVKVGQVTERSAPYMAKYIVKFGEITKAQWEEEHDGKRKPYLVYPREMLGVNFLLDNIDEIFMRGYFLDRNGAKVPIPRGYITKLEQLVDAEVDGKYLKLYEDFITKKEQYIEALENDFKEKGIGIFERYYYLLEQGKIRKEIINSRKRLLGKEMIYV